MISFVNQQGKMEFVSIKSLREFFNLKEISNDDLVHQLIKKLETHSLHESILIDSKSYLVEDLLLYATELNSQSIVFHEWVDQHKELSGLLKKELPNVEFADSLNWKNHSFYKAFQNFLAPFLIKSILSFRSHENETELTRVFSYIELLPEDEKSFVENQLLHDLKEKVKISNESLDKSLSETEFTQIIQPIVDEAIIRRINMLSRQSYATRIWYVDTLLAYTKAQACTNRLANWLLKQIEKIELNPEHKDKIIELKKALGEGSFRVKNVLRRNNAISLKSIMYFTVFMGLIGLCAWLIVFKPFQQDDEQLFDTKTSFEQFTKNERHQIDSILREIKPLPTLDEEMIDPYMPMGNGVSIATRTKFANARMEELYQDLLIDSDQHDQGLFDSCVPFSKSKAKQTYYPDVLPLSSSKGKEEVMVKNESGYAVYIIKFSNTKGGKIYSHFLSRGEQLTLKADYGDHFLFIAGNELSAYTKPPKSTENPSDKFDHHFCSVDMNYSESLAHIYSLENPVSGKNKILFSGNKGDYFSVIDLYGILSTY